jgi:hypothetical protein
MNESIKLRARILAESDRSADPGRGRWRIFCGIGLCEEILGGFLLILPEKPEPWELLEVSNC